MPYVIEWTGDELWNLLNLPNKELFRLYADLYSGPRRDRNANIRSKANSFRRKLNQGRITMPERSQPYNPETEPGNIERRRAAAAMHLAGRAMETTVITVPTEHLSYHEKLQAALQAEGALSAARFSDYEMGYKDADGEAQTHALHAARFEVKFDSEPKWPVVNRVEGPRLPRKEVAKENPFKTCMIFPDVQIPFEDEKALEVALRVMRDVKPDKVVFLGDLLDLSAWGKFVQEKRFRDASQDAVVRAYKLLALIRKAVPSAEIQVMAGNHEERLPNQLLQNAREAYGIKPANKLDGWPVMSVPFLCAFDTLDVDYIPGYPANRIWLNKNLQIRHGNFTQKRGAGARRTSTAEKISTIQGHDHRLSSYITTVNTYEGGQQIHTYGSGCLCRLDGHVPSYHSGKDLDGVPVTNYEDWSQAFIVASYDEQNFHVEQVPINTFNNYQTMFRGKLYAPREVTDGEV